MGQNIQTLCQNWMKMKNYKIKNLNKKDHKKSTLGGCIFFKKGENLCLEIEKLKNSS